MILAMVSMVTNNDDSFCLRADKLEVPAEYFFILVDRDSIYSYIDSLRIHLYCMY